MIKPLTEKRLYNITLFYLSKYDASSAKVRQMLLRRIDKTRQAGLEIPTDIHNHIEVILKKMKELGYLDDNRFAENQVRILLRQGKSTAFILQKLNQAGISNEIVKKYLTEQDASDTEQAFNWLKRHKKGGFRTSLKQPVSMEFFKKDLAALGRQGFSFCCAKAALTQSFKYQINESDLDNSSD